MTKKFENKYLEFLEAANQNIYNRQNFIVYDHNTEVNLLTEVIELHLNIIQENNWNYEDFLDYELRSCADVLYNHQSIDSRSKIYSIFDPEFKKIYNNKINIKLYFLHYLIETKIPIDITPSICYLSDAMINTGNIDMIYGCIMILEKYNNPLSLPVIEKVFANISDNNLNEDIIRYSNIILASINNKYSHLIIDANLNHCSEFVRKQILNTYNYFKKINGNG